MSECKHNNSECLICLEELESALDRTTYAWNRTKERVAELESALRTWKNMMANPNYDLGEMATEFNAIVREVLP